MTIECRFLDRASSYERTVTGWVDTLEGSLLQLNARLSDGPIDLEVSLVAEPSPSYQLSAATAHRALRGDEGAAAVRSWRHSGNRQPPDRRRLPPAGRGPPGRASGRRPPAGRGHGGGPPLATGDADRPARLAAAGARGVPPAGPRGLARAPRPLLHVPGRDRGPLRGETGPDAGDRRHVRGGARPAARVPPLQAEPRRPRRRDALPLPVDVRPGARVRALVRRGRGEPRGPRGPGADPPPPLHGHLRGAAAAGPGHDRREARRRLGGGRAGATGRAAGLLSAHRPHERSSVGS